jgi:Phytanoyl-CoA dioxygenase (PhyH)
MAISADAGPLDVDKLLAEADALVAAGRTLDAIDLLAGAAAVEHPALDRRLAELRHAGFAELDDTGFDAWPVPIEGVDRSAPPEVPRVDPGELTADAVRRAILSHGCVVVPGLFTAHVDRFVAGIEQAIAAREATVAASPSEDSWFRALPLDREQAQSLGRYWVAGSGGMLACDSPRLLRMLFETYTTLGLREVVAGYLGERPVLSANKATLRKVPLEASTDWHQDGAFLGTGIRALNIWIALSDCGVDSPGMDLVPKRFDEVCETGTGGAIFDWAVGPETVARVAGDAAPVRPHFKAGDAVLFDELYLHRTAIEPTMTRPRYAIESWFFAASCYPSGQVPLVW